jgi:hypothetical protein
MMEAESRNDSLFTMPRRKSLDSIRAFYFLKEFEGRNPLRSESGRDYLKTAQRFNVG